MARSGSGVLAAAVIALLGLLGIPVLPPSATIPAALGLGVVVGLVSQSGRRSWRGDQRPSLVWLRPAVLPAAIAFAAGWLLPDFDSDPARLGGALLAALLIAVVGVGQLRSGDDPDDEERWWGFLRGLLTYLVALAIFGLIYGMKERSLVSGPTIGLAAGLLAWSLLASPATQPRRLALYAALVGLLVGQTTWALNYWAVQPLIGGAFLMLLFYVLIGLAQGALEGTLDTRTVVEYALVGLLGFGLVLSTAPWR